VSVLQARCPHIDRVRRLRRAATAVCLAILPLVVAGGTWASTATGTYVGNDADDRAITGVGFAPDLVIVHSLEGRRPIVRTTGMPVGLSRELSHADALDVDRVQNLLADGFEVGTHDDVNKAGETYVWIAFAEVAGQVAVGSYAGSGIDDRSISGLGFRPGYVMVISGDADPAWMRPAGLAGDASLAFDKADPASNRIQALGNDGFEVGSDGDVNGLLGTYYYAAWKGKSRAFHSGRYTGDGTDDRDITGVTFEPSYLLIANDRNYGPIHRSTDFGASDASLPLDGGAFVSDGIQGFISNGFQVGTRDEVNGVNDVYYWMGWNARTEAVDASVTLSVSDPTPGVGDTLSLTVDAVNSGPSAATGVTLLHLLPAELTYLSHTVTRGAFDGGSGKWNPDSLLVGTPEQLVIEARVADGSAGMTFRDSVFIAAIDQIDADATNDSTGVGIEVGLLDLSVDVAVDDAAPDVGDTVTLTTTLQSLGAGDATGVAVTLGLPTGLSYTGDTPSQGSFDDGTGVWTVGGVVDGASATLSVTATVAPGTGGDSLSVTGTITAADQGDPNPGNDTDDVAVIPTAVDLGVTIGVADARPEEGDTVEYSLSVINAGPDDATGVSLSAPLPAGLTFAGAVGTGSYDLDTGLWTIASLPASIGTFLTLRATVDPGTAGTTLVQPISVIGATEEDVNGANDADSVSITIADVDLQLTSSVTDATPDEGQPETVTYRVRNLGPDDATGVAVSAILPGTIVLDNHAASRGTYDDGTGAWTVGALDAGDEAALLLSLRPGVGTSGTSIDLQAFLTASDPTDLTTANDTTTVTLDVTAADLAVSVAVAPAAPNAGDTVAVTVTLTNEGPDDATGIGVDLILPSQLDETASSTALGSYLDGRWNAGSLVSGDTDSLVVNAVIDSTASGLILPVEARVGDLDQGDLDDTDDRDVVLVPVGDVPDTSVDLALSAAVSDSTPDEGAPVLLTYRVTNTGPDDAAGVAIAATLPGSLTLDSFGASHGTYDDGLGTWSVGDLDDGDVASLLLSVRPGPGTSGTTIDTEATLTVSTPLDGSAVNDTARVSLDVTSADLAVTLAVAPTEPDAGDTVAVTVSLTNQGPDDATGVAVDLLLPSKLEPIAATPDAGAYDEGAWTVGDLGSGASLDLEVTVRVAPAASGLVLPLEARIADADQGDPDDANDRDLVYLPVGDASDVALTAALVTVGESVLRPGVDGVPLVKVRVTNPGFSVATLRAVTVTNASSGPGAIDQLDGNFLPLTLWVSDGGALSPPTTLGDTPLSASFAGGSLSIVGLDEPLAPADTLDLVFTGGASLDARDGDLLAVSLAGPSSLVFEGDPALTASFPLTTPGRAVDGMTAAQIEVTEVPSEVFLTGSRRNLALHVRVPANGYTPDTLQRLNVINAGTATSGQDLLLLEAWVDVDDDGILTTTTDRNLGSFSFTGDRWELTGLGETVPVSGLPIMVSVDVADDARDGRTVTLGLPTGADVGVGMASDDDGPLDADVLNPSTQLVGLSDRIVVTLADDAAMVVRPGEGSVEALHLVATNTYGEDRALTSIALTNRTDGIAGGDADDHDQAIAHIAVHADGNGNGVLDDPITDPLLQSGVFEAGRVTLAGLSVPLPAGERRDLFIAVDVALHHAADGDTLALSIDEETDLRFDVPSAVLAEFPLRSEPRVVDGMVAGQLQLGPLSGAALAPGDGPVLALDVIVPANGHATDTLTGISLSNLGTATATDLSALTLHRDDGDGVFDVALDPSLGDMFYDGGASLWRSPSLTEPIPEAGVRLFATITVSTTPTDSASVRLAVPVDGVTVASTNDGPIDASLAVTTDLVLSTSPLLASLAMERAESVLGQEVMVTMTVRNVSDTTVVDIVPSSLTATGGGGLVLSSGPSPSTFDLDSGESGTFSWTYLAEGVGEVRLRGDAQGTAPGGTRRALPTETDLHRLLDAATAVEIFPVANMPFSIVRGQENVVPLTLTLSNPGGPWTSDAALTSLRIRIEDDDGQPVAAEDLLARFSVREGATTYLDTTAFASVDGVIDLPLGQTVTVTPDDPVSLGLSIDLLADTMVPAFRLVLEDSTALGAVEAITSAGIEVLHPGGAFPVTSGLGNVLEAADGLTMQRIQLPDRYRGQGQIGVFLMDVEAWNLGIDDISTEILLRSFTFRLKDEEDQTFTSPDTLLDRFWVRTQDIVTDFVDVEPGAGPVLTVTFSPPLECEVNQVEFLELVGNLSPTAPLGAFQVAIEAAGFDAVDATTGEVQAITLTEEENEGYIRVEAPADSMVVAASATLPGITPIGARSLPALELVLHHPGVPGTGSISVDSLWIACLDERRDPVDPEPLLDRVRVLRGIEEIAVVGDPEGSDGRFAIPFTGMILDAGEVDTLRVLLDVEASAPRTALELVVDATDLVAFDVNQDLRVTVAPAPGTDFPATSGLTRLEPPADRIVVGFEDALPAVLGPSSTPIPVATVTITNPALAAVGDVLVEGLDVRATDGSGSEILLGSLVAELVLSIDDVPVATASPTGDAILGEIRPEPPLILPAGQELELHLDARFRDGAGQSLHLGLTENDVHVTQPGGDLLAIRVDPVAGQTFPFWTDVGHFTRLDLESSYANFPNPFAAGRQSTTFVFALDGAARVSLRLLTPRGDRVRTLLDGRPRPAGIHQSDRWDGRNGRGLAVRSGVYVAELEVRYEDGRSARILRKVAVVR